MAYFCMSTVDGACYRRRMGGKVIEVYPSVLRTQAGYLDDIGADLKSLGAELHRSAKVAVHIARRPDVAHAYYVCAETWALETDAIAQIVASFADRVRRAADNYDEADVFRMPQQTP